MSAVHELPEGVDRCPGCGKFVSMMDAPWGDHERRGCRHRIDGHECEMEDCGTDVCGCYVATFCSSACADQWHSGGVIR